MKTAPLSDQPLDSSDSSTDSSTNSSHQSATQSKLTEPNEEEIPLEMPPDDEGERFVRGILIAVAITFILGIIGLFYTISASRQAPQTLSLLM